MKAVLFVEFGKDCLSAFHAGIVFECVHVLVHDSVVHCMWLLAFSAHTSSASVSADEEVGQSYEDCAGVSL